ncbi:MAG: radical SAM protein [Treponema sp.]|nr:radical SAM protein [Treponema sp.]
MKKSVCFFTLLIETSPQSLPLGAACVASAVKNHSVLKDLVDVKLKWISKEDPQYIEAEKQNRVPQFLADKITEDKNYDFICFSIYVWNHHESEAAAAILKTRNPDCQLLCGGPEVTANPDSFKNFDHIITGEGEDKNCQLLLKLLDHPADSNPGAANQCPISCTTGPYLDGTIDPTDFEGGALWELSRGCPFKCTYCFESKGSKKIKYFPMDKIRAELELFKKKKVRQVFVLDPTYNADKKRALEILKLIAKTTPDTFYYFEARAEFIDREMAKAFTKIPCSLQFGLQSTNEEVLKNVNRSFNKQQFTRNIGFLNDEGVIFGFDLIYGLPGDNYQSFINSVDFALKLYPNNLETFCLSVLPGTVLYDDAEKFGLEFMTEAPYTILLTPQFPEQDISKAREFSNACNFFYNDGRAVPWFMSVCHLLKMQPSQLINEFSLWSKKNNKKPDCNIGFEKIQETQFAFLQNLLAQRSLTQYWPAVQSIIALNGAFSQITDGAKSVTVNLSYDPEELASPMALDIKQYAKFGTKRKCRIIVKNDMSFDYIK